MSCINHYNVDPNGLFSIAIYKISDLIKANNFLIIHYDDTLPHNVAGRIDYLNKIVKINCSCAGCAVIAIAHEAGHLLHFLDFGCNAMPALHVREDEAMKRGLKILRNYIDKDLISDEYWEDNHK